MTGLTVQGEALNQMRRFCRGFEISHMAADTFGRCVIGTLGVTTSTAGCVMHTQ